MTEQKSDSKSNNESGEGDYDPYYDTDDEVGYYQGVMAAIVLLITVTLVKITRFFGFDKL